MDLEKLVVVRGDQAPEIRSRVLQVRVDGGEIVGVEQVGLDGCFKLIHTILM